MTYDYTERQAVYEYERRQAKRLVRTEAGMLKHYKSLTKAQLIAEIQEQQSNSSDAHNHVAELLRSIKGLEKDLRIAKELLGEALIAQTTTTGGTT
jgi:hypothetical protein